MQTVKAIAVYIVFQVLAIVIVYLATACVERFEWSRNWIGPESCTITLFWLFMVEALATELGWKAGIVLVLVGEAVTLVYPCWPAQQHLVNIVVNLIGFTIGLGLRRLRDMGGLEVFL